MTRIQDDLFATVNAEWLENAEIPADKPRISAFDELVLKNPEKDICFSVIILLFYKMNNKHHKYNNLHVPVLYILNS